MAKSRFKWCRDKIDAIAYAGETGLDYHWLASKAMWLVCSDKDWNLVLRGDIIIC